MALVGVGIMLVVNPLLIPLDPYLPPRSDLPVDAALFSRILQKPLLTLTLGDPDSGEVIIFNR